jgi:hypothetical protein
MFIFKNEGVLTRILSFSAVFPIIFSNNYWWDFIPIGFFFISFGPMFIYYSLMLLQDYYKKGTLNTKYILLMGISSMLSFSSNAPVNANLIILALILPILVVSGNIKVRKIIVFYSVLLSLILFTNLWWIIPSYMAVSATGVSLGGSGNVYILLLNSQNANFFNILEYVHVDSPYIGLAGNLNLNNVIYATSIYLSVILLAFVAGTFFLPKEKFRRIYFLSLFSVLILDLLMMGINSPLKSVEIYLIDNNGILSEYLRGNPGTLYFALYFILTIIILVSAYIALKSYLETHKGNWHRAVVVVVLFLLIFSFISIAPQNYDGYAVPHYPYRSRMVVPYFDSEVAAFIKENSGQHYALLYPGGFLEQNITNGYDAYDILPSMIPQSLLIDEPGNNLILKNIYSYIDSSTMSENFTYYLYSENIKYIVIEGDIGGNYPFGFSPPPNYNYILSHLNDTFGVYLVKNFGPDYIYVAGRYPDGMISKAGIFSNNSIVNGDILPVKNITSEYYNDSFGNRTVFEPNATYNSNGITININQSSWRAISNLSYRYTGAEPIFYNSMPLDINTSNYNILMIKLKGNNNTVITPQLLTSSNVTLYSILNQSAHVLTGYPYNIRDNNNTATNEYGCDHYLMSNNTLTLLLLINSADPFLTIHYIYFSPGPLNKVYGSNLSFTIESMELANYFSSAYGMFLVKSKFAYNSNYTLKYTQTGYTDYYINATNISNGTNPIVLSLFTGYSQEWAVRSVSGVSSYKIIRLNNCTTGIVVYPKIGYNRLIFYVYFRPQSVFISIEYSLIASYAGFFSFMIAFYRKEDFMRISNRLKAYVWYKK